MDTTWSESIMQDISTGEHSFQTLSAFSLVDSINYPSYDDVHEGIVGKGNSSLGEFATNDADLFISENDDINGKEIVFFLDAIHTSVEFLPTDALYEDRGSMCLSNSSEIGSVPIDYEEVEPKQQFPTEALESSASIPSTKTMVVNINGHNEYKIEIQYNYSDVAEPISPENQQSERNISGEIQSFDCFPALSDIAPISCSKSKPSGIKNCIGSDQTFKNYSIINEVEANEEIPRRVIKKTRCRLMMQGKTVPAIRTTFKRFVRRPIISTHLGKPGVLIKQGDVPTTRTTVGGHIRRPSQSNGVETREFGAVLENISTDIPEKKVQPNKHNEDSNRRKPIKDIRLGSSSKRILRIPKFPTNRSIRSNIIQQAFSLAT